jgi:hypothetical protein
VDGGELYNSKAPFEDEQQVNNNPQVYPQAKNLMSICRQFFPPVIERGDSSPRNQPLNYATKVLFNSLERIFI